MNALLSGVTDSLLGSAKKALLIIRTKSGSASAGGSPGGVAAKAASALTNAARVAPGTSAAAAATAAGANSLTLEVQYNPSTISINANANNVPFQYLQQNLDNGIPNQNTRPPSIVLAVDLIFDAVNNKDAFMMDKFRLSAGDVVSAVSAVSTAKNGGYTVQPQTNGLVAALMRESTRNVTFQWADLSFTGEVSEVQARYTMFSVSGKPVRSVVRLNIVQQVTGSSAAAAWNRAFDKAFGNQDVSTSTGGKSALSQLSNLLNINI